MNKGCFNMDPHVSYIGYITCIIILLSQFALHETCSWPDDFDISDRGGEKKDDLGRYQDDQQRSWETNIVVTTSYELDIRSSAKTRTAITVTDSKTIVINSVDMFSFRLNDVTYECSKAYEGNKFMLTRTRNRTLGAYFEPGEEHKYRCMALKRHSRFVWQWALGPLQDNPVECDTFSKTLSEWPLVYWPISSGLGSREIKQNADLLDDYVACPQFGGYNIKAFLNNGTEISGCEHMGAPSRMEMECFPGEGVLLLQGAVSQTRSCSNFFFDKKAGSKLNCLGSWRDSKYTYSIVVTAAFLAIGSPKCLRVNTADPSSEPVVLFLDNICKSTPPNPETENYLYLELSKTEIKSRCDDTNSECPSADCTSQEVAAACRRKCDSCPDIPRGKIKEEFHGAWVVQDLDKEEVISVSESAVVLPILGTFQVYGVAHNGTTRHYHHLLKDSPVYVIGQDSHVSGCTTRVASFGMRIVSPSVAVIFYSGTSPVRNNEYADSTTSWCWNNDIERRAFGSVVHPYWPVGRDPLSQKSGWRNGVKSTQQKPVECTMEDWMRDVKFNTLYFNTRNGEKVLCSQSSLRQTGTTMLTLHYSQCTGGMKEGSVGFSCLGNLTLNFKYKMLIVESDQQVSDTQAPLAQRTAYCLMYPVNKYQWKYYNNTAYIHPAGKCDTHLLSLIREEYSKDIARVKALVEMNYMPGGGSSSNSGFLVCTGLLSFWLCLYSVFVYFN